MITLIGLPSTVPPKSSTAICAAVTDPCPVGVDAGPFMSVRTPILTTSSEIWARAAGDAKTAAANAPSRNSFLAEITDVPPITLRRIGLLLDRKRNSAGPPFFNHSLQSFDGLRQRSQMA